MDTMQITQDERLVTLGRGAAAGLIAATIFGLAEMAAALLGGNSVLLPVRMAASTWLAHAAFTEDALAVFVCGAMIHYAIAVAYGMVGAMLYEWTDWSRHARLGIVPMMSCGMMFGMLVWLVNLDVIAGNFLPWIWRANQPAQFLLHAIFFGAPLGASLVGLAASSRQPPDVLALRS